MQDSRGKLNCGRDTFISEFCNPGHAVRKWVREMEADFGGLTNTAAFERAKSQLWSGRLRTQVLGCIRKNVPLHGSGSDADPSVECCRLLVKDMREALQKVNTPAGAAAASVGAAAPSAVGADATNGVVGTAGNTEGGMVSAIGGDGEVDECVLKASDKTQAALQRLHFYGSCIPKRSSK